MRSGMVAVWSLLAAMPFAVPAGELPAAEPHGFSSRAEKAEVRLGEPFGYAVEIRHDPAERYELPAKLELDPFEAAGASCRREQKSAEEVVTTCEMRLALYDLGAHDVPDLTLLARAPSGDRVLHVPGARVTGVGVLDPSAPAGNLELRDIAPPVPVMVRSYRLLVWALGILGATGLIALALFLWKHRRRGPRSEAHETLAPHERFRRRLDALEAGHLPARGSGREYFFQLSEMLREYLGALFGVNALDLTTEEILAALSRRDLPGFDRGSLALFCRQADLVKFARHQPGEAECAEAMAYARRLLSDTRPRPAEELPGRPDPKAA